MKLPRDLSGTQLARALSRVGYQITRQTGSHVRLTSDHPSQHHVTVPTHDSLKLGTAHSRRFSVMWPDTSKLIATSWCSASSPTLDATRTHAAERGTAERCCPLLMLQAPQPPGPRNGLAGRR